MRQCYCQRLATRSGAVRIDNSASSSLLTLGKRLGSNAMLAQSESLITIDFAPTARECLQVQSSQHEANRAIERRNGYITPTHTWQLDWSLNHVSACSAIWMPATPPTQSSLPRWTGAATATNNEYIFAPARILAALSVPAWEMVSSMTSIAAISVCTSMDRLGVRLPCSSVV